ncbi:Lysosomal thioesterase ppt2 [Globisporangium polare]
MRMTASPQEQDAAPALLPVFFFHGVLMNAKSGAHFAARMAREGRHFVSLSFCTGKRSAARGLKDQVALAIAQIRDIVNGDDSERFKDGYVFIGYSQGSMLARAVIQEMDDHRVTTFISLAGAVNGVFYGPQPADLRSSLLFVRELGPELIPTSVFDFSKYTEEDCHSGQYQKDFDNFARAHPEVQHQLAFFGLQRSPVKDAWKASNVLLAELNNRNEADDVDQQRRRANFLKLQSAHFFASPDDGLVAPWQSSILGQYSELDDAQEIISKFKDDDAQTLHVVDMKDTVEYKEDTYGLRTLDSRGGLSLHVLQGVKHISWITDGDEFGPNDGTLRFSEIYDKHIEQLL